MARVGRCVRRDNFSMSMVFAMSMFCVFFAAIRVSSMAVFRVRFIRRAMSVVDRIPMIGVTAVCLVVWSV